VLRQHDSAEGSGAERFEALEVVQAGRVLERARTTGVNATIF
jgi:hypothetical protein